MSFEKLFAQLKKEKIDHSIEDGPNRVRIFLKNIAFKMYYTFNPFAFNDYKLFFSILKSLSKDKNVVILKRDKGNGIVLLNKADYISKMNTIIGDTTKFQEIQEDWFTVFPLWEGVRILPLPFPACRIRRLMGRVENPSLRHSLVSSLP